MGLLDNVYLAVGIIIAIIVAYVYARRVSQRAHQAKLASFSRKIEAAEQRDRDQAS